MINNIQKENNKRVAKNTIFLYFRMLLIMAVSLYTVRVVLSVLGVQDYGIFNVVAGIVTMFSFLSGTMTSASQRFFAFELGRNDKLQLKRVFSLSVTIHILIGLIIFFCAETLGVWFLNNKMTIPIERLVAANWIFQFSILSFMLTIFTSPYDAILIAHEEFSIYAFVSILEAVLKLTIVFLLKLLFFDKLMTYGLLIFFATCIISFLYISICKRKYKESHYKFYWDKSLFKTMISYAAWNMIGAIANIFKSQGVNILLNLFFGPIVNAAMGLAIQINNAINSLIINFYMAVRPQITKAYAAGEKTYMMQLVFQSAKFSFFLLLILSMPLLLETNFILQLWLKEVPEFTVLFTRLLLVNILIEAMNNQLVAALQSSGKIKNYQAVISILLLMILPISYVFFHFGFKPETIMYVYLSVTIICFVPQIWIVHNTIGMSIKSYLKEVILVMILVAIISFILPLCIHSNLKFGLFRFFMVIFSSIFSCLLTIYSVGLTNDDRNLMINFFRNKLKNN
jgi:O-antigen/teichoic acid export membrane protein